MPIMAIGSRWTQMLSSFLRGNNRDRFIKERRRHGTDPPRDCSGPPLFVGLVAGLSSREDFSPDLFANRSRLFPRKNDDNIWVHREPMAIIGIADHGFDDVPQHIGRAGPDP